jgi:hypothetical protein
LARKTLEADKPTRVVREQKGGHEITLFGCRYRRFGAVEPLHETVDSLGQRCVQLAHGIRVAVEPLTQGRVQGARLHEGFRECSGRHQSLRANGSQRRLPIEPQGSLRFSATRFSWDVVI